MKLDDRGMARREFRRILESDLKHSRIEVQGFAGYAGLLRIIRTDGKWTVPGPSGKTVIAAPGYTWLQAAPYSGDWWLTVMYDTDGQLIQYYFDIVDTVYLSSTGEPRFRDLFLDVVMQPDGSWQLLDEDELHSALEAGIISIQQYEKATIAVRMLISEIDGNEGNWRTICDQIRNEIKRKAGE